MDVIRLSQLLSTSNLRSYRDDDFWVDRLSHRYSVVIFSIFAILVTTKAYIGDPIDCWAPPEFKISYERYAETLCFVNGTYYISSTEIDIPSEPGERYSNRVRYYQWTPFILLLQAFFMYLPRVVWLSLSTKYGIHLRNLVDAAKKYESVDSCANREKIIAYLCKNLLRSIKYREYKANKRVLSALKKEVYLNRQLELNSLLTLMSMQPTLTAHMLNRQTVSKRSKHSKMKSSRSYDDLNNNHQKYNNNSITKQYYEPFKKFSATGNESRLKYVTFKDINLCIIKASPDQTREMREMRDHRVKSSRSHSNQNLIINSSSSSIAYNPAYYIIDARVDTQTLINYLNHSLGTTEQAMQFHIESPVSLLHAKITNISRKHLLSMLTNGCYEVGANAEEGTAELGGGATAVGSAKLEGTGAAPPPFAYLINGKIMRQLDSHLASSSRSREYELIAAADKKSHSSCALFNLDDNYLSTLYIVVKFLYMLSALCQLFFLNRLIGNNFYILGITLLKTFFNEIEWPHLDVFPRMTLCEIYIREVGTTHPYLIQCVLRINLFNEVIFVFVWYWLLFVICVTAIDLTRHVLLTICSCLSCKRKLFALKYLELVHLNDVTTTSKSRHLAAVKRFNANLKRKRKVDLESLLRKESLNRENEPHGHESNKNGHDTIYYDNNMFKVAPKPNSRPSSVDYSSSPETDHSNYDYYSKHQTSRSRQLLNYLNHKYMLILASDEEQFELFERFCEANFNNDTIFSLRVIEQNVSSLIVSEIVEHLWTQFKTLNCVYSTESNDYLLKKLFVFNDLRDPTAQKSGRKKDKNKHKANNSQKTLIEKF